MTYQESWMESLNRYVEDEARLKEAKKTNQPMMNYFNTMLPEEVKEVARKSAHRSLRGRLRR